MSTNARRRILVVDDHPDAADVAAVLLRMAGYETAVAFDGLEAVEVARAFKPDLVLMDIDMPNMDGYGAARVLRQEHARHLILIAHTGRTTPADVQAALDAGFDRHVSKPLMGEALCDLVDMFLAEKTAQAGHSGRCITEPGDLAPKVRKSGAKHASPNGHGLTGRSGKAAPKC